MLQSQEIIYSTIVIQIARAAPVYNDGTHL